MFTQNKYCTLYYTIIKLSKSRVQPEVVEKHHIVPKSLGGTDDIDNIAFLTPREHFLAHKLLVKMTMGENKRKMAYAIWRMCHNSKNHSRIISSKDYLWARHTVKEALSSRIVSNETRKKLSDSLKGRKTPWAIDNFKNLPENGNAKVWEVYLPDHKVLKLIGKEFSKFCKENSLSQGNLSKYGKSKGVSVKCLGSYYTYIKSLQCCQEGYGNDS